MNRHRFPRLPAIALCALSALVPTFFTLGLHTGPESVGSPTLEPTTVYKSEHRSEESETHLHAEIGFESVLCLACFFSLRNQTLLATEPIFAAMSDSGAFAPTPSLLVPASPPAHSFSSRAPPRV